jgi:hypothetical protein
MNTASKHSGDSVLYVCCSREHAVDPRKMVVHCIPEKEREPISVTACSKAPAHITSGHLQRRLLKSICSGNRCRAQNSRFKLPPKLGVIEQLAARQYTLFAPRGSESKALIKCADAMAKANKRTEICIRHEKKAMSSCKRHCN